VFESVPEILLWVIPGAPLLSALLLAFFGKSTIRGGSHRICAGGIAVSLVASLWLLSAVLSQAGGVAEAAEQAVHGQKMLSAGYQWMQIGGLDIRVELRADAMSIIMLSMVTTVSLLVAIYASGYMHHDPGYPRFFAAVSLFVFSMCMLVLAGSFALMFVFWEAVGLCSYLLIGFWFQRPSAAAAAKKAFVVNRIGDFGFLLGIFLIWTTFGSLDFDLVLGNQYRLNEIAAAQPERITLICLLLFVGAVGKSAQFPLHVWLPDAMEGPTPVSALIHAATMVTAGVYMVARCTPLFILSPTAQAVVGATGGITAVLAGLIALTQFDLKRVLAYSTVSQLGYMFMALGSAAAGREFATFAVMAAMFHMFTHAFFKALLFLGAGSVMHAMGDVIDMRQFGGLRKLMPKTHITFLVGSAALAGFPLLAGFWSKDEILAALAEASHNGPYQALFGGLLVAAILTAGLTAFYTFRGYFMTFWGPERIPPQAGHHAHESPPSMTVPLQILALFSLFIGLIAGPTGIYAHALEKTPGLPELGHHGINWLMMGLGTVAAVVGIGVAWLMYVKSPSLATTAQRVSGKFYNLSQRKFYFDEIYYVFLVLPLELFARFCLIIDRYLIDALVTLVGHFPATLARIGRPIQNGLVQTYALVMLLGLAFFVVTLLRAFG